jgi:5-hydroxyisourate hydrolase
VTVSTHVLDASAGRPAAGVPVSLWFLSAASSASCAGWEAVGSGETDGDGRHRFGAATPPGSYRLVFGTGGYFAGRGVAAFYPEVTITFTVVAEVGHYHVPLLLSPFAYSTYRGS